MGRTSDARGRLIESAAQLVYAHGYQGVGVEKLCDQAGVKKGSFYHFFPSKRDLTLAAVDHQWRLARQAILDPAFQSDLPPLERLQRFFQALAAAVAREKKATGHVGGCRFGNLAAEMGGQDQKIRECICRVFGEVAQHFERALTEARDSGEAPGIDPRRNADALVAYMEGLLLLAKTRDDPAVMSGLGWGVLALATARQA